MTKIGGVGSWIRLEDGSAGVIERMTSPLVVAKAMAERDRKGNVQSARIVRQDVRIEDVKFLGDGSPAVIEAKSLMAKANADQA